MELQRALSQLSDIHAQVLRSELFRGYRAATMAVTGGIAVAAAVVQAWLVPPVDVTSFVLFWVVVAFVNGTICGVDLVWRTSVVGTRAAWQRTGLVVAQFVPALVAGAVLTLLVLRADWTYPGLATVLPGLWAVLFSLGVLASRSYLPRAIGWVGAYYLAAGFALLSWWEPAAAALTLPSPWSMGVTFGIGQVALAIVLHVNLERGGRRGEA